MKQIALLAAVLLPLACMPISAVADAPFIALPGGGVDLSVLGDRPRIFDVFRARDGHLVLYVVFRDKAGATRSDYYDTRSRKLLFPDREIELAHAPGAALEKKLLPAGLQQVETKDMDVAAPTDHGIEQSYEGGSVCHEAYASPWTVWGAGEEVRFVILHHRDEPERRDDVCDGHQPYTLHYADLSGRFFGADMKGFFAVVDGAVIWFDWRGRSEFFKTHRDYVRAPYDKRLDCRDTGRKARICHLARERYIDSLRGK